MTDRISIQQYRAEMGLTATSAPSKPKRDQRWHHELDRQITFHPKITLGDYLLEYRFHPVRKFLFDFAFIDRKVAVEVQGIIKEFDRDKGAKSAHQTFQGVTRDCEKQSLAATLGWRVLTVTQEQIKDGSAVRWIVDALNYQL